MALEWINKGDAQVATSNLADDTHYELGQQGAWWRVDLVVEDEVIKPRRSLLSLGRFDSEARAKAAADRFEAEVHPVEGDGCAIYTETWYPVQRDGEEVNVHDLEVGDLFIDQSQTDADLVRAVGVDIEGNTHLDLGSPDEVA